jgi:hypothetical protein
MKSRGSVDKFVSGMTAHVHLHACVQRHAISGPTNLFANNSRFKYWLLKLLSEPVRVFAFSDGIRIPWRGVSWLMEP